MGPGEDSVHSEHNAATARDRLLPRWTLKGLVPAGSMAWEGRHRTVCALCKPALCESLPLPLKRGRRRRRLGACLPCTQHSMRHETRELVCSCEAAPSDQLALHHHSRHASDGAP